MTGSATAKIIEEYNKQRFVPFAWGTADCLSWCADCALAMTGRDPAKDLRGRYTNAFQARRVMVAEGWRSLGDLAKSFFAEINPAHARTGDWALVMNDGVETLGVVVGHVIWCRGEYGLGATLLTKASRAFRVDQCS